MEEGARREGVLGMKGKRWGFKNWRGRGEMPRTWGKRCRVGRIRG